MTKSFVNMEYRKLINFSIASAAGGALLGSLFGVAGFIVGAVVGVIFGTLSSLNDSSTISVADEDILPRVVNKNTGASRPTSNTNIFTTRYRIYTGSKAVKTGGRKNYAAFRNEIRATRGGVLHTIVDTKGVRKSSRKNSKGQPPVREPA